MARIVNLIPATLLRERTDIGVNYNETLISNAVVDAQELELIDVIGRPLYDSLTGHVTALVDSTTAIPSEYKTLLDDYIANYLTWVSYYNVLESVYSKPTSAGIGQRNFSAGTPFTAAQYDSKRLSVRAKVDRYATRLQEYVEDKGSSVFTELSEDADLPIDRKKQVTSTASPLMTFRRGKQGPNIY